MKNWIIQTWTTLLKNQVVLKELGGALVAAVFLFTLNVLLGYCIDDGWVTHATIIGIVAASTTTTFNLTYLPQYLAFTTGTTPSAIKVNALGDGVIMDIDDTGIDAIKTIRRAGENTNSYFLPLANGIIEGKNCEISVTNATASDFTLYGSSKQKGYAYVQSIRQSCLANSGVDFRDFAYIAFPSMGANDELNVTFKDGHTQKFYRDELQEWLGDNQNDIASQYNLDNLNGGVKVANFIGVAQQIAYVVRYQPATGVLSNSVVAK